MPFATPKILDPDYPPPLGDFSLRNPGTITDLIYHHSDGPLNQTPIDIDTFERTRKDGDIYIPYTYLVDYKGNIYAGRPPLAVSAASYGRNSESVAVCAIGAFHSSTDNYNGPPTTAQLDGLFEIGLYLHRKFPSIARTICHGDIAPMFYPDDQENYSTACCGDTLRKLVANTLKPRLRAALVH